MNKTVTFLLPRTGEVPIGGFKVVYEYANRMICDGYEVNIVYGIASRSNLKFCIRMAYYFCRFFRWLKYLFFVSYKPDRWFKTDSRIKHILRYRLNKSSIPETMYLFATSWSTAYWVNEYDKIDPHNKFYLIQAFEDWNTTKEHVLQTWKMPLQKIVIAPWLQKIAEDIGEEAELIENGLDQNTFYLTVPIEKKDKYSVTMMWHELPLKASDIGLKALYAVKKRIPELKGVFFGVPKRPDILPEWIEYYQMPSPKMHLEIYNKSAIYLAPSSKEGFGLTLAEAMLCGCAAVCTNIGGYAVVAKDGQTALISEVGDYLHMAENIIKLIYDINLRYRLASNGLKVTKNLTWDRAYDKMKKVLNKS